MFAGDEAVIDGVEDLDFDVWSDSSKLAANGFEWRFMPVGDAGAAFQAGRGEIAFCGFRLEPLRLLRLILAGDQVAEAVLLCRLSLGRRSDDPDLAGNLLRLTLKPKAEVFEASFAHEPESTPLRFALEAKSNDGFGEKLRTVVDARLDEDAGFKLHGAAFSIDIAGVPVPLGAPDITLEDSDRVVIEASPPAVVLQPGAGHLRVIKAHLVVQPTDVELSLDYALQIQPDVPSTASGLTSEKRTTTLTIAGKNSTGIRPRFGADSGVLTFKWECDPAKGWLLVCGVVVRLGPSAAIGAVPLVLGCCEAQLRQVDNQPFSVAEGTGIVIRDGRVDISLRKEGASAPWTGEAKLYGTVDAANAIRWPALTGTSTIPLPSSPDRPHSGRVLVRPAAGVAEHAVTWIFAGQVLPYAVAAALAAGSSTTAWTTLVTARHSLRRGNGTLRWTSVEPIVVGSAAALVPKWLPPGQDASSFAARYQARIVGGEYGKNDPGMHRPGVGAVGTILQGTLGAAFRQAFWKGNPTRPGLMIAGGFLGVLQLRDEPLTPLLRLPVLAGLVARDGSKAIEWIGQIIPQAGLELAWADGTAARLLAVSRTGAASPSDATPEALRAAVISGSRPAWQAQNDATGDVQAALLVEQSYLAKDLAADSALDLTTTPFFLASAVMVDAALARLAQAGRATSVKALCLVAGSVAQAGGGRRGLAAAIAMQDAMPAPTMSVRPAQLVILGDRLSRLEWSHGDISAGESLGPVIAGMAIAADAAPRASLLLLWDPKGALTLRVATFPTTSLATRAGRHPGTARFADPGRGALYGIGTRAPMAWMAPPMEGPLRAIRDGEGDEASGIAGLARRFGLPGQAGGPFPAAPGTSAANDLVWLSQTQFPVFLPLPIQGLRGLPMPWLTPAPPLVRLPTDADVSAALLETEPQGGGGGGQWQPFLSGAFDSASVGERAGVLTVRRLRLLTRLDAAQAFDADHARFGRLGQAGSSLAHKFRTPRPGILPPNRGEATHDRRIQASAVRFQDPFAAVIGSADVVQGEWPTGGGRAPWSITVIAAPERESIVTDRWDGGIYLECRIEVEVADEAATPPRTPLGFLSAVLLKPITDGATGALESRAVLRIGDASIAYRRAVFTELEDWTATGTTRHGKVVVALQAASGSAADLAKAFATSSTLPKVELHWTVHPAVNLRDELPSGADGYQLSDAGPDGLPQASDDRAPLTLRLPLYPVTAARGALPLTPATIIFQDPAYDRDLSGPPSQDRLQLTPLETPPDYPTDRGDLMLVLSADRAQVNRQGTVTVMLDIRFDRPMDEIAQARANEVGFGGDVQKGQAIGALSLSVQSREGGSRPLGTSAKLQIVLGSVYEFALANLREVDGTPARLQAGDTLVLRGALDPTGAAPKIWNPALAQVQQVKLKPSGGTADLSLTLMDDAAVPPPPALYAALLRTQRPCPARLDLPASTLCWRIGVPLHAQSPLPWRIDLIAPAEDFRKGLMRRTASFVWVLTRPLAELKQSGALYVIKSDRNGQTYLPETVTEFRAAT